VYPFKLASLFVRGIILLVRFIKRKTSNTEERIRNYDATLEVWNKTKDSSISACPEFSEIFNLDKNSLVGVEFVARIPDETAFIRIVGNDSISKQFQRRVYRTKGVNGGRYIKIDDRKLYLRKTQVVVE
jgi:hypothetical protein